ncbi:MAG: NDP-sugar synthase [Candidatus Moranbacteria bacterium]|nr:NDP-sugar synthase [Candidatus Moranbacteria bacterium]
MKILFIVLSGGIGKRLRPATLLWQKTLLPAKNGKRIIDYAIESSQSIGSVETKTVILARYKSRQVARYVNDRYPSIEVFVEPASLGTGGAILQHWDAIRRHEPEVVVILNGDHLVRLPVNDLLQSYCAKNKPALLVVGINSNEQYHDYIDVQFTTNQLLHKFPQRKSRIAYTGIFLARFDSLDEYMVQLPIMICDMTCDIMLQIYARYGGDYYLLEGEWDDLGTWRRYLRFLAHKSSEGT